MINFTDFQKGKRICKLRSVDPKVCVKLSDGGGKHEKHQCKSPGMFRSHHTGFPKEMKILEEVRSARRHRQMREGKTEGNTRSDPAEHPLQRGPCRAPTREGTHRAPTYRIQTEAGNL